ncbi:hypothetical protein AVEN_246949-1 [Araneus ventricosus]|uniref:Uncharacterized protein n=1 Tax=Araneus ventricosus TaxID=182803 RepID=A0A4Y2MFR5_ARAVE|nr:hypothetical protein AVEN_57870-1 [Araneus ventricosus]GBN24496.1 hypothetical protein AVEN_246949-1 [Araneus ventricosus]
MRELRPTSLSKHSAWHYVFINKDLFNSSHIFLRVDGVRRPLQQPYQGPFKVLSRTKEFFLINFNGQKTNDSIDKYKPAYTYLGTRDFSTLVTYSGSCSRGYDQNQDRTKSSVCNPVTGLGSFFQTRRGVPVVSNYY